MYSLTAQECRIDCPGPNERDLKYPPFMMELLSNSTVPQQMSGSNAPGVSAATVGASVGNAATNSAGNVGGGVGGGNNGGTATTSNGGHAPERILAGILESFPSWDLMGQMNMGQTNG